MSADAAVLDRVFRALSDATRREVVQRLTQGPASVTELAFPTGLSLPGFMKHLRVLEEAGVVVREKEGRTVRCELAPRALEDAAMWLARYETFWNGRLDALGRFLDHEEDSEGWKKTNAPAPTPRSRSSAATPPRPRGSGGRGRTRKP